MRKIAVALSKGVGTINGAGDYGFLLMAIDEELTPSSDIDLFRIKIWDKENGDEVVYDNQMGQGDDSDTGTAIGGGNIKIHQGGSAAPTKPDLTMSATVEVRPIPTKTALLHNYPNPFNPETWFPYQLASEAKVKLRIYNVQGQLVRQLDLGHQPAGYYVDPGQAAHWDGKDSTGQPVASGMYVYQLQAGDFTATRRMLIVK